MGVPAVGIVIIIILAEAGWVDLDGDVVGSGRDGDAAVSKVELDLVAVEEIALEPGERDAHILAEGVVLDVGDIGRERPCRETGRVLRLQDVDPPARVVAVVVRSGAAEIVEGVLPVRQALFDVSPDRPAQPRVYLFPRLHEQAEAKDALEPFGRRVRHRDEH